MTTHETITACENICRDFSWLGEWMPALIAASVALLIAFGAYPWQKKKDRENELKREQREQYRAFIPEWHFVEEMLIELQSTNGLTSKNAIHSYTKILRKSDTLIMQMALCGSPAVVAKMSELHNLLYETYVLFGEKTVELYLPTDFAVVPDSSILNCLQEAILETRERRNKAFEELVNLMRSEEFGVTGYLEFTKTDLGLERVEEPQ